MQGIGAGRLIAQRYALTERKGLVGVIEIWDATDATLGRGVSVTVFPSSMPRAEAILQAARRSASVTDPRFVRVLDVGTMPGVSWLVEESLSETRSIASLLAQGPLPPEEARRIGGEVAVALDAAARRGLHHLHVTPHAIRRSESGLIKVAGLATAAAIHGTDEPSGARAARRDTVSIVGLIYATMTTRWPLSDLPAPGLAPAPHVVGGVAAPSEIAIAVPPDLDALCRSTLTHDGGPRTPGELVGRITPWSNTLVRHLTTQSAATRPLSPAGAATELIPAARPPVEPAPARPARPPGTLTRVATQHREHRAQERAARATAARRELEQRRADPRYLNLPEALEERRGITEEDRFVAPLVPAAPGPQGRHSGLVLAVVISIVAVALALSLPALFTAIPAATTSTPSPAPASSAAPAPATSAPARTPTAAPVEVAGIRSFDPYGDGTENEDQAPRVLDGDLETAWRSEGYEDEGAVGSAKPGVGVILELARPATVSVVRLSLPASEQDVTVYAGTDPAVEGSTEVGAVEGAAGDVDVRATTPVTDAGYVIVWFTRAARQEDGRYRAVLAEAAVT